MHQLNQMCDLLVLSPGVAAMGNLLRVLYKDDSPTKADFFVDFESEYLLDLVLGRPLPIRE